MAQTRRALARTLLGLVLAAAAFGCSSGPKMVTIKGQLTRNGIPLKVSEQTLVTIMFTPAEGGTDHSARFDRSAGLYEVKVPEGKYRVKMLLHDYAKPGSTPVKTQDPKEYELTKDQTLDLEVAK